MIRKPLDTGSFLAGSASQSTYERQLAGYSFYPCCGAIVDFPVGHFHGSPSQSLEHGRKASVPSSTLTRPWALAVQLRLGLWPGPLTTWAWVGKALPSMQRRLLLPGYLRGGARKKWRLPGGPSILPPALGPGDKIITILSGIEGSSLRTHFTTHTSKTEVRVYEKAPGYIILTETEASFLLE